MISTIIVRTSKVYTSGPETGCSASGLLQEMQARWQANHTGVARDTAHMLSGEGVFTGTIGCAFNGVICDSVTTGSGYGVSRAISANMASNVGLLAHELGHNWSANHCDATPPCNIMCSSLNGAGCGAPTSFGAAAVAEILAHKATRTCLATCAGCIDTASYTFFGSGCAGSGTGSGANCLQLNWSNTQANTFFGQAFDVAIPANTGATPRRILGIDLYCRSLSGSLSLPVMLYDKDAQTGDPGNVLATGTMTVGTTNGTYTATFASSLTLPANTDFFVGYANPASGVHRSHLG